MHNALPIRNTNLHDAKQSKPYAAAHPPRPLPSKHEACHGSSLIHPSLLLILAILLLTLLCAVLDISDECLLVHHAPETSIVDNTNIPQAELDETLVDEVHR